MHWTEYPPGEPLRAAVRAAIEEASGEALPVNDPLPDELITAAQAEAISLNQLHWWIYSPHPEGWSATAFVRWWRAIECVRDGFRALAGARP